MGYYWCPPLRIQQIHCSVIWQASTDLLASVHQGCICNGNELLQHNKERGTKKFIDLSFVNITHFSAVMHLMKHETLVEMDVSMAKFANAYVVILWVTSKLLILLTFIEWAISWLHQECVSKSWQGYEIDDAAAATRRDSCAHIDDPIFHQVQRWHPPTCKTNLFWRFDSISLALVHG